MGQRHAKADGRRERSLPFFNRFDEFADPRLAHAVGAKQELRQLTDRVGAVLGVQRRYDVFFLKELDDSPAVFVVLAGPTD